MTSPTVESPPAQRRHTLGDIFHERTNFQFIGRSWRWALLSGSLVLIATVSLVAQGLNLGIDFTGGLSWTVQVQGSAPAVQDVRDALRPLGQADAKISIRQDRASGDDTLAVQLGELGARDRDAVADVLADFGEVVGVQEVSGTWGETVTEKAVIALVLFFVLVALYLTFRFEWKMALAAIIAVLHDIVITVGVYAITQFEVTPPTVVAFLTILGFSLYDTVVVFDKVRENLPTIGTERGDTYSRMVNRSLNQVLMRSLNTSFVAVLPVISLLLVGTLLFGAVTLRDFALALLVGLLVGAYSSIFVATPILAWLKERESRYVTIRERVAAQLAREAGSPGVVPEPAQAGAVTAPSAGGVAQARFGTPAPRAGPPQARPVGPVAPRPRQQRRRKRR